VAASRALHWNSVALGEALGVPSSTVRSWVCGRASPPLVVVSWLERLASVHVAEGVPEVRLRVGNPNFGASERQHDG
jgi:hypothetical protein